VQRQPVLGEQVWEREMNRLRRIRALLIIALAAVIVRVAIDGAKLIVVLAGALILGLLLCTLALIRQGGRWRRHAESDNERSDAR
jgi:membrane protein YdbS with pleckstrin-like domain